MMLSSHVRVIPVGMRRWAVYRSGSGRAVHTKLARPAALAIGRHLAKKLGRTLFIFDETGRIAKRVEYGETSGQIR